MQHVRESIVNFVGILTAGASDNERQQAAAMPNGNIAWASQMLVVTDNSIEVDRSGRYVHRSAMCE
ncbi:hypothetical protein SCP_1101020 [Sparassis crispa]|uniref:Uncharacterized protein n=1 Tax=Sparassis crispa TaxID=139825 RepID=A0A401GZ24_9APHY|nr:hypothetical protein SCP_1101020 [Sparassis crispa]GBE87426.1 hypothetical protein SCP_1101020 [Sparassis crispa]